MAFKVKGVQQVINKLNKFGVEGARYAVAITNQTADNIVNQAKVRSPVDLGQLRQSNGATRATVENNRSVIYNTAPYSPYQNFGTGGLVDVPEGFEPLAFQFKGAGIRQVNVPATGFLTTPYIKEAAEYPKRLQKAYDKLIRQFNNK